jgi:hypothetical protein
LRDGAAADALGQDNAFWKARARNHVKLNYYRLVYRSLIYGDGTRGRCRSHPSPRGTFVRSGAHGGSASTATIS